MPILHPRHDHGSDVTCVRPFFDFRIHDNTCVIWPDECDVLRLSMFRLSVLPIPTNEKTIISCTVGKFYCTFTVCHDLIVQQYTRVAH